LERENLSSGQSLHSDHWRESQRKSRGAKIDGQRRVDSLPSECDIGGRSSSRRRRQLRLFLLDDRSSLWGRSGHMEQREEQSTGFKKKSRTGERYRVARAGNWIHSALRAQSRANLGESRGRNQKHAMII
jgi:hypothetical protein